MIKVIKYIAEDGVEFDSSDRCLEYEKEAQEIELIMSKLYPEPKDDGLSFLNGHGYIQHDKRIFTKCRNSLLDIAKRHIDQTAIQSIIDCNSKYKYSYIRGLICDIQYNNHLHRAWNRILATDGQFREWGLYYYVLHPEDTEHIKLN